MKALEDVSDDEHDIDTVSSILNSLVDQVELSDNDEMGLAQRIGKRPLITSAVSLENNVQQIKRLRSNTPNANVSI